MTDRNRCKFRDQQLKTIPLVLILIFSSTAVMIGLNNQTAAIDYGSNTTLDKANILFQGEMPSDLTGSSVSFTPDLDGDGIDDLLIGSERFDSNGETDNGKVYVIRGKTGDWTKDNYLSDTVSSFLGEYSGDRAGIATPAGDVNGDGLQDILIGAPYNDEGGTDSGQVYLIFGKAGGFSTQMSLSNADASFIGENSLDRVGEHISTAGDMNGDGFDDFLIGAPGPSSGSSGGKIYVIYGKGTGWDRDTGLGEIGSSFKGDKSEDHLQTVCGAGDVNSDGLDDIMLGAPNNDDAGTDAGKIYLILGKKTTWQKNSSVVSAASSSFNGENPGDKLSKAAFLGDVNGDGYEDILLGAPDNNDGGSYSGKVYLLLGGKQLWNTNTAVENSDASFMGDNPYDYTSDVAGAGDVDGDGLNDLIITSPRNDKNGQDSGQVYLFLGKKVGWSKNLDVKDADASFQSTQAFGKAGSMVGRYMHGDINGDGLDDLIIGEPGNSDILLYSGKCYLFFTKINIRPSMIKEISLFSDPAYTRTMERVEKGETIYIEVIGEDQDNSMCNLVDITVASKLYDPFGIRDSLKETTNRSGVFRGSVFVKEVSHESNNWIGALDSDEITIKSFSHPSIYKKLNVGPRIKIKGVEFTTGDGPDGKTVYNELKPYTIKVLLQSNKTLESSDLESVILNWQVAEPVHLKEPRSLNQEVAVRNIKLGWNHNDNLFSVIECPEGWLSLASPGTKSISVGNNYELYFALIFHWAYPENTTTTISTYSVSGQTGSQWTNFTKTDRDIFFKTKNRAMLTGDLEVVGEVQGTVTEGSYVLGNEKITWTGLKAVYYDPENPKTVYVGSDTAVAQITDSIGNVWQGHVKNNLSISIETIIPESDITEITYVITLEGLKKDNDLTDISFTLQVTSLIPKAPRSLRIHSDSYEDKNSYADNDGELFLTWEEPEGYRWDLEGYYYSFSNNELTSNGFWTDENRGTITLPDDQSDLKKGMTYVFVWARDIYGSLGYSTSGSIFIDTTPVTFSNATPAEDELLTDTKVTVSIMVTDTGGSGVNGSSLSYRKSTTGLDGYGPWLSYGENMDGIMIFCSFATVFEPGEDNYIQWRAKDIAGNGFTLSEDINIKINPGLKNSIPTVSLLSPENNSKIRTDTPLLYWKGTDSDGDKLYFDVYFSSDYGKVASRDNSVLVASNMPNTQFGSSMPLVNGETYYWTVIPNDGIIVGTCLMDVWNFEIEITVNPATTKLLLPHDNSIVSTLKPTFMWTVDFEGSHEGTISFDVYLDSNPNPTKIVSANQLGSTYSPTIPLENGKNYYWKVIPYMNDIKGRCESGVWGFNIDLDFSYEINIESDYNQVNIKQGDFQEVKLYISNIGNQPDTIKLYLDSDNLKDITFNTTELILPRYDNGLATLYIHIPDDKDAGTYTIDIRIVSEGARIQGQNIEDEITITVKVVESDEGLNLEELMGVISFLTIFIVILSIMLVVAFALLKRSKRKGEEYKTLYYIQKYSKTGKGNSRKPLKMTNEIIKTRPLNDTSGNMKDTRKDSSADTSKDYTLEERLAILKYLRNSNNLNEKQYNAALLNLRNNYKKKGADSTKMIASSIKDHNNPLKTDNKL